MSVGNDCSFPGIVFVKCALTKNLIFMEHHSHSVFIPSIHIHLALVQNIHAITLIALSHN
jgi:hypothetical protein